MLDMKREVKRGYTCSIYVKGINAERFTPDSKIGEAAFNTWKKELKKLFYNIQKMNNIK